MQNHILNTIGVFKRFYKKEVNFKLEKSVLKDHGYIVFICKET